MERPRAVSARVTHRRVPKARAPETRQGRVAARRRANGDRSSPMRLAPEAESEWCLQQGGEMGARMRALDWSRTTLGPVRDWPRPLKVAVALCLRSRFPIVIFWGRKDYAMLYNDAYVPLL